MPKAPPPSVEMPRGPRNAKIAAVLAALALVVVAQRLGLFERLAEPAKLADSLVELGPWGYLAFVLAYAALQPFGVPGTVFVIAAPLIWPWPIAFALSMTGTMAASCVGFAFARFVAREWVASRIPERFRRYDEALAKRAFATVFTLRLIFWMPPLLHAFFGVSKVRFSTHFWGSLAGYVPTLLLLSYFGQKLFDALKRLPASTWLELGALLLVVVAIAYQLVRRGHRTPDTAK